jgi:hypothetical protein
MQVLSRMYEKEVKRGDILIREGDSGADADEMYVVKSGHFEVSILFTHCSGVCNEKAVSSRPQLMMSLSQGLWISMLGSPADALELPAVVAVE